MTVAIAVLFLAFELRAALVLRDAVIHHISVLLLWIFPILACTPIAIYWKTVSTIRSRAEEGQAVIQSCILGFSTALLTCFLLLLLWDNLLGDIYSQIGFSPK
jgi:hypothetical protein